MTDANCSCELIGGEATSSPETVGGSRLGSRLTGLRPALAAVPAGFVRTWLDVVHLQRCLLQYQRPWERQGPLRWKRELGGLRLVGAVLPQDGHSASPSGSGS